MRSASEGSPSENTEPRKDASKAADRQTPLLRQNAFGNNPWRQEEKDMFVELLKKHGKNFGSIATELGSRSAD